MKSNFKKKMSFAGVEMQLADCAVCMLHTYIAEEELQADFLRYLDKQNKILLPYVEAYIDNQNREIRDIGKNIPNYNEMLVSFSQIMIMMYIKESDFRNKINENSRYSSLHNKYFPDIEQTRLIFVQYAKLFYMQRMKAN